MKILILDIETSPNVAHVWAMFKQNIGVEQLLETHDVLCWAAKWLDDDKIMFGSRYHDGQDVMIGAIWHLLNEADAVVHFNGKQFDIPHLNRTFILRGMAPPSPYKQIDLLDTMKSRFRFSSNRLKHIAKELLDDHKKEHEGHTLWIKCLNNDPAAWEVMKEYNIHDVVLTEKLYLTIRGWIKGHPNVALLSDNSRHHCPNCGSYKVIKQGYAYTSVSKFQQYQCKSCGRWSRERKNLIDRTFILSGQADG